MAEDQAGKNHDLRLTLFSVSAGMVGVCLTGVGLIGVVKSVREMESAVDELLTVSALLFLVSMALYFITLRRKDQSVWKPMDRLADTNFFLALALLLVGCAVFTIRFR
jgi:hypothetical protein